MILRPGFLWPRGVSSRNLVFTFQLSTVHSNRRYQEERALPQRFLGGQTSAQSNASFAPKSHSAQTSLAGAYLPKYQTSAQVRKKKEQEMQQLTSEETNITPCGYTFCDHVRDVQGGPSGRGTLFGDIKFKVPSQYKLLIL